MKQPLGTVAIVVCPIGGTEVAGCEKDTLFLSFLTSSSIVWTIVRSRRGI